jgi:hypothetical protein
MWALALALIILSGVAVWLIAAGAAQIEHRRERWLWDHPPEDEVCREDREDQDNDDTQSG